MELQLKKARSIPEMQPRKTSKKGILWKHQENHDFNVCFLLSATFSHDLYVVREEQADRSGYQSFTMLLITFLSSRGYRALGPIRRRLIQQRGKQEPSPLFWRESEFPQIPVSQRTIPQEEDCKGSLGFYPHDVHSRMLTFSTITSFPTYATCTSWLHYGCKHPWPSSL